MPWFNIPDTTPLVINVDYVIPNDSPPPSQHSLAPPAGGLILGLLGLPAATITSIEGLLGQGLAQVFQTIWTSQIPNIQNQIANAIGHDTVSDVPTTGGTLKASVDPLGAETAGLLPVTSSGQPQPGQQLSLSYVVPGVKVNFSEGSTVAVVVVGILGVFGIGLPDPSWQFFFDAQLNFYLAVPFDATVPMGFKVEFVAANMTIPTPTNFSATLANPIQRFIDLLSRLTGNGSIYPSSQTSDVSDPSLTQYFSEMSSGFVAASKFGFTQLAVQINTSQQNAIQFDLTHPFDDGPVPRNYYVPWLMAPSIQLDKSTAHPGDPVQVTGTYWSAPDPTSLDISWDDTTSGLVTQTEVNYGQVFASSGSLPPSTTTSMIDRTTRGSSPIFSAQGLVPSATYGFRLRDYDAQNFIATAWGPWRNFTTGAAIGTSAQIALDNDPSAVLKSTSILPGGAFVTSFNVPTGATPGKYNVLATAAPNVKAQYPLTVVDASHPLPPIIEIYDPNTLLPSTPPFPYRVMPGNPLYLAGLNWAPGEVDVYVNSTTGQLLGKPVADSSGIFRLPTSLDEQGPTVTQIWAQQGSVGVGFPIEELPVPK